MKGNDRMLVMNSLRWSVVGSLLGGTALLGCDPQVIDYEDVSGVGGASSSVGGASSSAGGAPSSVGVGGASSSAGGAPSSVGVGGASSSAGGAPSSVGVGGSNLGGAAQVDDFPWPYPPMERGVVAGIEPWDTSATGCCSRAPGGSAQDACLEGIPGRVVLEIEQSEDIQSLQFDMASRDGDSMVLMSARPEETVNVGVMETTMVPPEGIVDLSPVFWVGSDGPFPASAAIYLPVSQYGYSVNDPGVKTVLVYYSEDGVGFEALEKAPLEVFGNGALMTQPGYVVVGAGPDVITCHP